MNHEVIEQCGRRRTTCSLLCPDACQASLIKLFWLYDDSERYRSKE